MFLTVVLALFNLSMENLLYQKFVISVMFVQKFILGYTLSCVTQKCDKCKWKYCSVTAHNDTHNRYITYSVLGGFLNLKIQKQVN